MGNTSQAEETHDTPAWKNHNRINGTVFPPFPSCSWWNGTLLQGIPPDLRNPINTYCRTQKRLLTQDDFIFIKTLQKNSELASSWVPFGTVSLGQKLEDAKPCIIVEIQETNLHPESEREPEDAYFMMDPIIQPIGFFKTAGSRYWIFDSFEGREFLPYLKEKGSLPLPEDTANFYAASLVRIIKELHAELLPFPGPQNLILKPDGNIVVARFPRQNAPHFRSFNDPEAQRQEMEYKAPGLLTGWIDDDTDLRVYDGWTLGVIIFELLTGIHPFSSPDSETTWGKITKVQPNPIPESVSISEEAHGFLTTLIRKKKPAYWQLLEITPWVKDWENIAPPFKPDFDLLCNTGLKS